MKTPKTIFLIMLLLQACSSSKSPRTNTTVNTPGKGILTGSLQIETNADSAVIGNATVTIQNQPESFGISDSDGNYSIPNVQPGTINVIITSTPGSGLLEKASYGAKIDGILVKSQGTTDVGKSMMKKTGALLGRVTFYDNPNNLELAGSEIYIPGTQFLAKTDASGAFSLSGLPEGVYELKLQHTGFSVTTLASVTVVSDAKTNIGNIPLSLALGPEGGIAVIEDLKTNIENAEKKISKSREVTLELSYDGDAALMKVSDEPSFLNKKWLPVKKNFSWTFNSDGEKNLYVMYSDLNGLESSPFSDSVIVETLAPSISSVRIMNGWSQTATRMVYLDLSATDLGSGVHQVMLSNSPDFSSGAWLPYEERIQWMVSSGNGSKTVFVKVRDYADNESIVKSDSINKGATTVVQSATYSEKVILYKEHSPYTMESVAFNGGLEIRAGTSLKIGQFLGSNNIVQSLGTENEPVHITSNSSSPCNTQFEIDTTSALPGLNDSNKFIHTHFEHIASLHVNGGHFESNEFDNSCTSGPSGSIIKDGTDRLSLIKNNFTNWKDGLKVLGNISSTQFIGNTGTIRYVLSAGHDAEIAVRDNSINVLYDGMVYDTGRNSFIPINNTWSGAIEVGVRVSSAPEPYTFAGLDVTGASIPLQIIGSLDDGLLTVRDLTLSNCETAVVVGYPNIKLLNLNVSNCAHFIDYPMTSVGMLEITDSTIQVSEAVLFSKNGWKPTELKNSNITCTNNAGICDLISRETVWNTGIDDVSITNNTINCSLSSGCRGFAYQLGQSSSSLTLNLTVTGNTVQGKSLDPNLAGNIFLGNTAGDLVMNDPLLKLFSFAAGGGTFLTLNVTQ